MLDSCVWIALFDSKSTPDEKEKAITLMSLVEPNHTLVIPFPTLYEFLNSRLSRKEHRIQVERILSKPNVIKVSDESYKSKALEYFFLNSKNDISDVSIVDEVLKLMFTDDSLNIDYFFTFDKDLEKYATSRGIKTLL